LHTIDPLGGSYYIESLTKELENKATDYIDRIKRMGGALKAIESGYIQREIQNSAYTYQKQVEAKEEIVVGVNDFIRESEEAGYCRLIINRGMEQAQKERLLELKKKRDNEKIINSLGALRLAASSNDNIMEPVLEAVRAYATVGEICQVLREIFGEYIEFKEI
ncbi:MAG: methylmalonyl-CoA mutase family protein, partial [Firmicutes bacterium]|nr:methylmalonyl-CoA mutase family protein [Bacillota bacterium]